MGGGSSWSIPPLDDPLWETAKIKKMPCVLGFQDQSGICTPPSPILLELTQSVRSIIDHVILIWCIRWTAVLHSESSAFPYCSFLLQWVCWWLSGWIPWWYECQNEKNKAARHVTGPKCVGFASSSSWLDSFSQGVPSQRQYARGIGEDHPMRQIDFTVSVSVSSNSSKVCNNLSILACMCTDPTAQP